MKFNFNGRDDGLGNRLEELIKLQNFCQEYGHKVIYRWNNDGKFKYPIIFSCKDISIIEAEKDLARTHLIKPIFGDYMFHKEEEFSIQII